MLSAKIGSGAAMDTGWRQWLFKQNLHPSDDRL